MKASGVLVANEIHPTRVLTLAQNVERLGVVAAITNETPQRLAQVFPSCFDAVLVDAPCSGEGMFRKDPSARSEWSIDTPETCAARQKEIFAEAIRMTRPGGRIVYSTCTFNPVENEQVIQWALDTFPLTVLPLPDWPGWESGRPDWADGRIELLHTRRLWPHKGQGEGHFVASLQVTEGETSTTQTDKFNTQAAIHSSAWSDWAPLIAKPPLSTNWESPLVQGDLWFARSAFKAPSVKLRLLRPGLCLAQQHKGRFEPHHSLAMAIAPDKVQTPVNLSYDDAARYLSGQTVDPVDEAGYVWLHIDGLPLGWGKSVPGRINNLFPKGLRKHDLV
jgi:NOL1/NOP2/fmu family ribosome biogenesis protein